MYFVAFSESLPENRQIQEEEQHARSVQIPITSRVTGKRTGIQLHRMAAWLIISAR